MKMELGNQLRRSAGWEGRTWLKTGKKQQVENSLKVLLKWSVPPQDRVL